MELIKYFISTSFITAAVIFIGKLAVGKMFDGMVETYKYKLNTELEEFKTKQQKLLDEYKITYSKLHDDRSNIIIELYRKLVRLEGKIEWFVQQNRSTYKYAANTDISENTDKCLKYIIEDYYNCIEELKDETFQEFFDFVDENDIFFSQELAESLKELNKNLAKIKIFKGMVKDSLDKNSIFESGITDIDKINETFVRDVKTIKCIKKELQSEFRDLLGVN